MSLGVRRAPEESARRHPAGSGQRGVDAATVLTCFLFLLFLVPAPMVIGALGTAGHPATVASMGAMAWWVWHHSHRIAPLTGGRMPVRTLTLAYLGVMLTVYAHAMLHPLPFDEISPADSGLLRTFGAIGIVLIAVDGLTSLDRAWAVARRLTVGAGLVAGLAVAQYITGRTWVDAVTIPGLARAPLMGLETRGDLIRPSGTATNAIEFAVVLTMALPIAITVARASTRRRRLYWVMTGLIAVGVLLSISRTAIIGSVVALLVLLPILAPRTRALIVAGAGCVLVAMYLLIPGLAGTFAGLFTTAGDDPSVQSRTGSYAMAGEFISTSPWLGRGYGTFLPRYWILDNLYLQLIIETGFVGVVALIVLIAGGVWSGRAASRAVHANIADRELARALMAALASAAVSLAFFDAFSFPESAGCFFLVLGLCGAVHRLICRPLTGLGDPRTARRWPVTRSSAEDDLEQALGPHGPVM